MALVRPPLTLTPTPTLTPTLMGGGTNGQFDGLMAGSHYIPNTSPLRRKNMNVRSRFRQSDLTAATVAFDIPSSTRARLMLG